MNPSNLAQRFFQRQAAQTVSSMAQEAVPADGPNNPDATWWCKLLGRAVGVFGGIGELLALPLVLERLLNSTLWLRLRES